MQSIAQSIAMTMTKEGAWLREIRFYGVKPARVDADR
jgi:hypothetical protein